MKVVEKDSEMNDGMKNEVKFEGKISDHYKPLMDYVLLQHIKNDTTAGGLVMPEAWRERKHMLPVAAVGPQVTVVKEGEWVFMAPNVKAYVIELFGEEYIQVREIDIYATISKEFVDIDTDIRLSKLGLKSETN